MVYKHKFLTAIYHQSSLSNLLLMGPPKRIIQYSKPRNVHGVKFGRYHLDLVKYSDHVYAVHICYVGDKRFGLGSGFISMSLNTWDEFFNHAGFRLNVEGYDVLTIFRSTGLFLLTYTRRGTPLSAREDGTPAPLPRGTPWRDA